MDQNPKSFYQDNKRVIKSVFFTVSLLGTFVYANLGLNLFSPNTTISSTEVNENFQKLEEALLSDLVLKNTAGFTIPDPTGCKSNRQVVILPASGTQSINYNSSNGEFSFSEGGLYGVVRSFKCNSCSKQQAYLCADADQGSDCLTEGKPVQTYIGDFQSTSLINDSYIDIVAGKVYRIIVHNCNAITINNADDVQLYFRKIR